MAKITKTNEPIANGLNSAHGAISKIYKQEIDHFARLGKEIKISPKANVSVNKKGYRTEFFVETVTLVIGIGKDHTADLIMSKDAWEALDNGEKINITTTEDFKKKYVYKK